MKELMKNPRRVMWLFFAMSLLLLFVTKACLGQAATSDKTTLAILSFNTKNVTADAAMVQNIVQLEVMKTNVFSVLDPYDVNDILKKNKGRYADCYGKTCLVGLAKELGADQVLTGNVERFGDKIVVTLRLIDVKTEAIAKGAVGEFLDIQEELQNMIKITVNDLLDRENDPNLVNLLVDYDAPISSPMTTLRLNGPRMGFSVTMGDAAERLQAPKTEGGYEMFPVITQFGYQFETQYLSAGNFQALLEFIGLVGGLESGVFIPSISVLNGFRSNINGWEFAFGPSFKLVRTAPGYYDENGDWFLAYDWDYNNGDIPYEVQELPDSRGSLRFSTSLVLAVGKTFKSGYLNIPVNVYVVPNKKGTIIGTSIGFNISKKTK